MRDQAAWAKAKAADAVERGQEAAEESISRAGQAARDHSTRARASGSNSLEQGQQAAEQRLNGTGRLYAMLPPSLLLLHLHMQVVKIAGTAHLCCTSH